MKPAARYVSGVVFATACLVLGQNAECREPLGLVHFRTYQFFLQAAILDPSLEDRGIVAERVRLSLYLERIKQLKLDPELVQIYELGIDSLDDTIATEEALKGNDVAKLESDAIAEWASELGAAASQAVAGNDKTIYEIDLSKLADGLKTAVPSRNSFAGLTVSGQPRSRVTIPKGLYGVGSARTTVGNSAAAGLGGVAIDYGLQFGIYLAAQGINRAIEYANSIPPEERQRLIAELNARKRETIEQQIVLASKLMGRYGLPGSAFLWAEGWMDEYIKAAEARDFNLLIAALERSLKLQDRDIDAVLATLLADIYLHQAMAMPERSEECSRRAVDLLSAAIAALPEDDFVDHVRYKWLVLASRVSSAKGLNRPERSDQADSWGRQALDIARRTRLPSIILEAIGVRAMEMARPGATQESLRFYDDECLKITTEVSASKVKPTPLMLDQMKYVRACLLSRDGQQSSAMAELRGLSLNGLAVSGELLWDPELRKIREDYPREIETLSATNIHAQVKYELAFNALQFRREGRIGLRDVYLLATWSGKDGQRLNEVLYFDLLSYLARPADQRCVFRGATASDSAGLQVRAISPTNGEPRIVVAKDTVGRYVGHASIIDANVFVSSEFKAKLSTPQRATIRTTEDGRMAIDLEDHTGSSTYWLQRLNRNEFLVTNSNHEQIASHAFMTYAPGTFVENKSTVVLAFSVWTPENKRRTFWLERESD